MDSEDKSPFGYDAFRRTCPSHTVLEMLASKWVYLVICALRRGRLRNGELARKLEGISPKMLTHTLRVLERDGLVRREIFPVIPPRVEYELTEARPEPGGAAQSDQVLVRAACSRHQGCPRGRSRNMKGIWWRKPADGPV